MTTKITIEGDASCGGKACVSVESEPAADGLDDILARAVSGFYQADDCFNSRGAALRCLSRALFCSDMNPLRVAEAVRLACDQHRQVFSDESHPCDILSKHLTAAITELQEQSE